MFVADFLSLEMIDTSRVILLDTNTYCLLNRSTHSVPLRLVGPDAS
jgi:hypothetical protein